MSDPVTPVPATPTAPPTPSSRRFRLRHTPGHYLAELVIVVFLLIMAIIEFGPISWIFATSLRAPADSFNLPPDFWPTAFHWENYLAVIQSDQINFLGFFWNSLKIASIVTIAQLITTSMAGFAFGRLRFPGRDFLFFFFLASLMVPATVTLIPNYILIVKLFGLKDSHFSLILPALTSAFGVFLMRQQFKGVPNDLMDAAKMDGAGYFRIYWQIMLPHAAPTLTALAIFTFLASWNNYLAPLLFLRSWDQFTFPLAIVLLNGYMGSGNRAHVLAAVMISLTPALIIFLVGQRFIIRGVAITGMKG